ncbi:hypothetical protein FHR84_001746 [Actinopolyspora biskrensis]|uniref:Putative T7SS secretion signal domain-containing protein n=1 Tax=Actinopolyspora biskrensis TaxID=1470178 RepID=A0A852YUS5_9ACTN|nr:hypothetical protein [Actinopolyspora biskrensis]NYH78421.1 hypothetical protein [Actinopolyspora biskrensis]
MRDDLGKMDVGDWEGGAADSFRASFSKEPPKWMAVRDSLNSASGALLDYAETLRWAQNKAGEAVTLWEKGEAEAQRSPSRTHAANASSSAAQAGDQYREQARELLSHARRELDAAGTRAVAKIRGGAQSPGALDSMVEAITEGWSAKGKTSASGPDAGWSASWPKGEKMGELKAFAQLAKASAEGSLSNGPFKLSGKAAATVAAEASLSGAVTNEGIAAKAEVMAGGKATAQGKAELGPYTGYNPVHGVQRQGRRVRGRQGQRQRIRRGRWAARECRCVRRSQGHRQSRWGCRGNRSQRHRRRLGRCRC